MKVNYKQKHAKSKRKLSKRLKNKNQTGKKPMFSTQKISYEIDDKNSVISCGGLGAIQNLVNSIGLSKEIDQNINLLKEHKPYHESDHIMNMVYNILAGGENIENIKRLRNNPEYMDSLGAVRIPDSTTAGDFLRRFQKKDILTFMEVINYLRVKIWTKQNEAFKQKALICIDATIEETTGECKKGMNISYDKRWGYAPLLVSLANTREPLFIENRPGNTPSHVNAAFWLDKAIDLTSPIFKEVWLLGDTDYSLTKYLDRWDAQCVKFVFGYDAIAKLRAQADLIADWKPLVHYPKYEIATKPRKKQDRVKDQIVIEKEYKTLNIIKEEIAEFYYQPINCEKSYRMIVNKQIIEHAKGQTVLFQDIRYFFHITNDPNISMEDALALSHTRCNHENDIEQMRNGVKAFKMPTNDLISNWAYMVIASLAWTLKSWMGLLMPYKVLGNQIIQMEFPKFLAEFINIPVRIVRTGRKIYFKICSFMKHAPAFFSFAKLCSRPLKL